MSSHDHLKNLIQRIELSLTNHYTISIATAAKEESWSASVFYVSDQKLNIYFISFDESKHIQGILKNKKVSATINQDVSDWMQIKGLQLQGVAYKVPEQHRKNILNAYRQKFDSIHELLDLPKTDDEKKIAKQFNIDETGYRLITNCGSDGGQEVPYLHFHLVGGLKLGKMISLSKTEKKRFNEYKSL